MVSNILVPADVLVPNWVLGKPAAFDLSVTSTLNTQVFHETNMTAGSAAQIRKHGLNDERCRELGWVCIPLVVRLTDVGVLRLFKHFLDSPLVCPRGSVVPSEQNIWKAYFSPCESKLPSHPVPLSVNCACYRCS